MVHIMRISATSCFKLYGSEGLSKRYSWINSDAVSETEISSNILRWRGNRLLISIK